MKLVGQKFNKRLIKFIKDVSRDRTNQQIHLILNLWAVAQSLTITSYAIKETHLNIQPMWAHLAPCNWRYLLRSMKVKIECVMQGSSRNTRNHILYFKSLKPCLSSLYLLFLIVLLAACCKQQSPSLGNALEIFRDHWDLAQSRMPSTSKIRFSTPC
jgi:hypothetical protein